MRKPSHRYSLEQKREMIALYRSGMLPTTIAETFGCNAALICYYIDNESRFNQSQKFGTRQLPLFRTRSYQRDKITNDLIKCFIEKYVSGFSLADIGEEYRVGRDVVRLYLKRSGVSRRPQAVHNEIAKAKRRLKFPMRWQHREYWYIHRPEHPMARKNGYIAEHRFVMEQWLREHNPEHPALVNGYLSKEWDVHHKNEIKTDNRVENLEPLPHEQHCGKVHKDRSVKLAKLEYENELLKSLLLKSGIRLEDEVES